MGDTFGMRLSEEDRQMLAGIASKLQRTESESMRLIIREVGRGLGVTPASSGPNQDSHSVEEGGTRAALKNANARP